jgi:hypothetical protein
MRLFHVLIITLSGLTKTVHCRARDAGESFAKTQRKFPRVRLIESWLGNRETPSKGYVCYQAPPAYLPSASSSKASVKSGPKSDQEYFDFFSSTFSKKPTGDVLRRDVPANK